MAQRNIAQYFEQTDDAKRTNDKWLSDHFYNKCLETGSMVSEKKFAVNCRCYLSRCKVMTGEKKVKLIVMLD